MSFCLNHPLSISVTSQAVSFAYLSPFVPLSLYNTNTKIELCRLTLVTSNVAPLLIPPMIET